VAVQSSGATPLAGTLHDLAFAGQRAVTIAAGSRVTSDPVTLPVTALSTLLVSVFVPGPTGPITFHPFTAQGNFLATGDQAAATSATGFQDTPCWMLIYAVDVQPSDSRLIGAAVALGDSITDTANTTGNANHRWPDDPRPAPERAPPAPRCPSSTRAWAATGCWPPRPEPFWGVAALDRLDRDVLTESGVRAVILLEGINDIGFDATSSQIIAGYQQIVSRAHAHGLPVFGATMTPFRNAATFTAARSQTWTAVNQFVRTGGTFDGVVDLAAATAAPGDAMTLNAPFDSGDQPAPERRGGPQAMANAIDVAALVLRPGPGPSPTPTPTPSTTPTAHAYRTPTPTPTAGWRDRHVPSLPPAARGSTRRTCG